MRRNATFPSRRLPVAAVLVLIIHSAHAFLSLSTTTTRIQPPSPSRLLAGGEGGDSEWAKALFENSGDAVRDFEKDMKLKGLMKGSVDTNPKLTANQNLIDWLTEEGDVYLSEQSSWGEAPHPMASKSINSSTSSSSSSSLFCEHISHSIFLLFPQIINNKQSPPKLRTKSPTRARGAACWPAATLTTATNCSRYRSSCA